MHIIDAVLFVVGLLAYCTTALLFFAAGALFVVISSAFRTLPLPSEDHKPATDAPGESQGARGNVPKGGVGGVDVDATLPPPRVWDPLDAISLIDPPRHPPAPPRAPCALCARVRAFLSNLPRA